MMGSIAFIVIGIGFGLVIGFFLFTLIVNKQIKSDQIWVKSMLETLNEHKCSDTDADDTREFDDLAGEDKGMIEKYYGLYLVSCDCCGDVMDDKFATLSEAMEVMKQKGWMSMKVDGEWNNLCPICLEEMK